MRLVTPVGQGFINALASALVTSRETRSSMIDFRMVLRNTLLKGKPMNPDQMWRLNLARERGRVDSVREEEKVGPRTAEGENPNELLLTEEDRLFLSQAGIRL